MAIQAKPSIVFSYDILQLIPA